MKRYITLLHLTEQGSKSIKQSTTRAQAFANTAAKAGVKLEGQYWTVGSYDGVLILSAEKQSDVLRLLVSLAAAGNVETETMEAFNAAEFDAIAK
jgi:uncharacterized protein with GYD domain